MSDFNNPLGSSSLGELGEIQIVVSGIASTSAFGTPRVDLNVSPSGIASTAAFGSPQVDLNVHGTGIASTINFGTPQVDLNIHGTGIGSTAAIGTVDLSKISTNPTSIESTISFGGPQVDLNIHGTGIASTTDFGTFSFATNVEVSGIASSTSFGNPSVELNISPSSIESTVAFGISGIPIEAEGIAPTTAFGDPLVERDTIRPNSIEPTTAFGTPSTTLVTYPEILTLSDVLIADGESLTLFGTGFRSIQGAGYVELNSSSDGTGTSVIQTVTSWSSSSITITISKNTLLNGLNYLFAETDLGEKTLVGFPIDLESTHATLVVNTPPGDLTDNAPKTELDSAAFSLDTTSSFTSKIHYSVVRGILPESLTLNANTGNITGQITEIDNYAPEFDANDSYNSGSAAMYSGDPATSYAYEPDITIRIIEDPSNTYNFINPPYEFVDLIVQIPIKNNWSSDRDALILNSIEQLYIDGLPVSNADYLAIQKSRGYFV